jgi:hypothetical protein
MSRTKDYLLSETEKQVAMIEQGAVEAVQDSIKSITNASTKLLISLNDSNKIMLPLIGDEFDTHDKVALTESVRGYIKNILEGTYGTRSIQKV